MGLQLCLRAPSADVSLTVENIADFVAAYIVGNLLQMGFRFWAFRRWVFPDEFGRNPEKAIESTFTAGGIAEAFEDAREAHNASNVTPLRRPGRRRRQSAGRPDDRLSDSSPPKRVENFVIQQRVHLLDMRNVVELQRIL